MRLNKYHKESIVEKVLNIKFPDSKKNELKKEIAIQARSEIQSQILDGYQKYSKHIKMSSEMYIRYRKENGRYTSIYLNVEQFPTYGVSSSFKMKSYGDGDYPLCSKKVEKLVLKYFKFDTDKESFKLGLMNALASINTDKLLKEHIPKLVKYLPVDRQCGLVPVNTFDDINKKLKGL